MWRGTGRGWQPTYFPSLGFLPQGQYLPSRCVARVIARIRRRQSLCLVLPARSRSSVVNCVTGHCPITYLG